jgi:hypothetical protein
VTIRRKFQAAADQPPLYRQMRALTRALLTPTVSCSIQQQLPEGASSAPPNGSHFDTEELYGPNEELLVLGPDSRNVEFATKFGIAWSTERSWL